MIHEELPHAFVCVRLSSFAQSPIRSRNCGSWKSNQVSSTLNFSTSLSKSTLTRTYFYNNCLSVNVCTQKWSRLRLLLLSDLGRCTPMNGRCQWMLVQYRVRLTVWPICTTLESTLLKTPALDWLDLSLSVERELWRKEHRWERIVTNVACHHSKKTVENLSKVKITTYITTNNYNNLNCS